MLRGLSISLCLLPNVAITQVTRGQTQLDADRQQLLQDLAQAEAAGATRQ